MDKAFASIALLIVIGIVLYLLYINGYLAANSKRAIMYVGFMGGRKAAFTSCTGYTKRVIKFRENKDVHFQFDLKLSKGDVTMELLDSAKQCILKLDRTNTNAVIPIHAKKRYYLVFRFKSASGSYLLSWE